MFDAESDHVDGKPTPCRVCGSRAAVEHITEPALSPRPVAPWSLTPVEQSERRYAQVACRMCHTTGPRVLFERSDEWPHIGAERHAVEMWDLLHMRRK